MSRLFRFCAALWSLMEERISTTTDVPATRKQRRRMEREGLLDPHRMDGQVKVVTLRRATHRAEGEADGAANYSHRFIVSGHWRWQWHPKVTGRRCGHCDRTDGFHRQRWIAPHAKGPDDKPLLVNNRTVMALRR